MMAVCQFFGLDCEPLEGRRYATFTVHPSPSSVVAPKMWRRVGFTEQDRGETRLARTEHWGRKTAGLSMGRGYWDGRLICLEVDLHQRL